MIDPDGREFFTKTEAAALAERSESWVDKMCKGGRLQKYRLGGRIYLDAEEVRKLIEPIPMLTPELEQKT